MMVRFLSRYLNMPTNEYLLLLCEEIARNAHAGQYRRDGVTPYIVHPEDVASRLKTTEEKCVAWLHDVVEDTDITAFDLYMKGVPSHIIKAVIDLTKIDGESYETFIYRVILNPLARQVKIADIESNLSDSPTDKQIAKYTEALKILRF
jgi:(p)ppGpp synthase/HD superfamily hydrolase